MITPRGDFTGALKIWMNGQVLFDQSLVKTMYPNVGQTSVILWLLAACLMRRNLGKGAQ